VRSIAPNAFRGKKSRKQLRLPRRGDGRGENNGWYQAKDGLVIGGPRGSAVEAYCAAWRMKFHVIEEDGVSDFLAVPLPSEEEDRYLLTCEVAEVKEDLKQTESVSFDFLPDSGTLPF
jgi:hypothetical protein